MIRVTVRDLENGDEESCDIENDYVVTVAGNAYVAHTSVHANGTHVITIKGLQKGARLEVSELGEGKLR